MDEIKKLFGNIAQRVRSENNLSDITLAFCDTYPEFKKEFLNFFFPEIKRPEEALIHREIASDDSRPDFIIEADNGKKYLIEVKIMDRNHHFKQYYDQFSQKTGFIKSDDNNEPCFRFGYITNYIVSNSTLSVEDRECTKFYSIKTWQSFYNMLGDNQSIDAEVRANYMEYLKNVCGIINYKKMNLSNLTSLYYLNNAIQKVIKETLISNWTVNESEIKHSSTIGSQGYGFYCRGENNKLMFIEFLVFFYPNNKNEDDITIDISVSNNLGANKMIYPKLEKLKGKNSDNYSDVYIDENIIYFELIKNKTESFINSSDNIIVDKQLEILKEFYQEVMDEITVIAS